MKRDAPVSIKSAAVKIHVAMAAPREIVRSVRALSLTDPMDMAALGKTVTSARTAVVKAAAKTSGDMRQMTGVAIVTRVQDCMQGISNLTF